MNKFIQFLGGAALAVSAAGANAELSYAPNEVFDSESGLRWRLFETLEEGQTAGFTWASVAQTADLFLHYAPPDADGTLPGYNPEVGGITDYTTSGDGLSYSFSWESSYDFYRYYPPVLSGPFGFNISYGEGYGGPGAFSTEALLTQVSSSTHEAVPVLFRDAVAFNQYGEAWGQVEGIIDPPPESLDACPCPYYDFEDNVFKVADYYDEDGTLLTSGYLMVSSVPEPSRYLLFLAGIAGVIARVKLRKAHRAAWRPVLRSVPPLPAEG